MIDGGSAWSYLILMLASFSSTYGQNGYAGTGFDKFGLACGINTAYGINTASINRDFSWEISSENKGVICLKKFVNTEANSAVQTTLSRQPEPVEMLIPWICFNGDNCVNCRHLVVVESPVIFQKQGAHHVSQFKWKKQNTVLKPTFLNHMEIHVVFFSQLLLSTFNER